MPYTYTIDSEKKRVISEAAGKVTSQELQSHLEEIQRLFSEGTLNTSWSQLTLIEGATVAEHNPVALVRSLAKKNPWPAECPRAMVTDNKFIFALCRMYQQLTAKENSRMKVTHSRKEAEDFLKECREQVSPLSEA